MSAPNTPQPLRLPWLAVGWLGVALSVYFSLKPHPPELGIENGDKVQHLVGYALLMLWWVQLADTLPQHYAAVMATDKERFNRFFHAMLDRGVYLAPALYEAGFVSAAHADADIAATITAAKEALRTA